MKFIFLMILWVNASLLSASTFGFQSLTCSEVVGPNFQLVVKGQTLEVRSLHTAYNQMAKVGGKVHYAFSLLNCRFKPFSVEVYCAGPDQRSNLKGGVIKSKLTVKNGSRPYFELAIMTKSIPDLKSYEFAMYRIDYGAKSRCVVNGLYEVRASAGKLATPF